MFAALPTAFRQAGEWVIGADRATSCIVGAAVVDYAGFALLVTLTSMGGWPFGRFGVSFAPDFFRCPPRW